MATLDPDVGSLGNRDINEFFGELSIPLVNGKKGIESLELELAGRLIDEENFGSGETYQIKGAYSPVDWLTFSAGYGTSFRAPDTGENFGTGIVFATNSRLDPCLPTTNVLVTQPDGLVSYDSRQDERNDFVISLCNQLGATVLDTRLRDGNGVLILDAAGNEQLDPVLARSQATMDIAGGLGLFGIGSPSASFQNFSVLTGNGGSTELTPETSDAFFAKVSFEQPWFCLLYTSPSPRDKRQSRMPSSA